MNDAWIVFLLYWAVMLGAFVGAIVVQYVRFRHQQQHPSKRYETICSPFDDPTTVGGH
jgi:hypothetical protein